MRHPACVLALSCCLICPAAAFAASPASQPAPVTVDDLLAALKADAAKWAHDADVKAPAANPLLSKVYPTAENLAALKRELAETQSQVPLEDLFVRYQLLLPLRNASAEQLKGLTDTFTSVEARAKYMEFPPRIGQPPRPAARGQAETAPATGLSPREEQFLAPDRRVLRNNILVRRTRATLANLRLLAGDATLDRAVMRAIQDDIEKRRVTYRDGLAAIEATVTEMKADRAKVLYDELKGWIAPWGNQPAEFTDPAAASITLDEPSRFDIVSVRVGPDLVAVVNVLATAAHQPAVQIQTGRGAGGPRRGPANPPPGRPAGRAPRGP